MDGWMCELKSQFSFGYMYTQANAFSTHLGRAPHISAFSPWRLHFAAAASATAAEGEKDPSKGKRATKVATMAAMLTYFSSMWDLSSRPESFSVGLASFLLLRSDGQT